jgi:CRISPR-associated endonuclease/helicase Cas3
MLYARKDAANIKQPLFEHLAHVADLSVCFAREFSHAARLSGMLHDVGKATGAFQQYLMQGGARGSVVHSLQGAFCVSDFHATGLQVLVQEIIEMTVAAHHGGLADCVSISGDSVFFDRMNAKSDPSYHYDEVQSHLSAELNGVDVVSLFGGSCREMQNLLRTINSGGFSKESASFALGLFVKYLYSVLVDADRLDAYLFDAKEAYVPVPIAWDTMITTLEANLSGLNTGSGIEKIRAEISEKCKIAGARETGIYKLSVPTGGGKTLSSLRFALHHAMKKKKRRIIYVIPYLSITTQTASEIRKMLNLDENSEILLEHHSNVVAPESEEENSSRKLASARWDNPMIVTTMVRFLESVMSARAGDLRKFHNMQDSVIVFDEIQSLPIHCIHLFNETVSFLSKILNTTVLLCTATQPLIDQTNRKNLLLSDSPDLIDSSAIDGQAFARTKIIAVNEEKTVEELAQFVLEKACENGSCLCIVNTKSEARKVYRQLAELDTCKGFEHTHLSTSMCGEHRKEVLNRMKSLLRERKRVICVSTQLIEAGVDISFCCVVRVMAGLDSILQAAGRCNRNGESNEPKCVYAVSVKDEKGIAKLHDIKQGKEIALRIIRENPNADYLSEDILKKFYRYYFFSRFPEMDCPVNGTTVYDMLSCNNMGKGNYNNRTGRPYAHFLSQAFSGASENFRVIDDKTQGVIVPYGEAKTLLEEFSSLGVRDKISSLRKLQKYSVSLYHNEMEELYRQNAIYIADEEFGFIALCDDYYSEEYGVIKDEKMKDYVYVY